MTASTLQLVESETDIPIASVAYAQPRAWQYFDTSSLPIHPGRGYLVRGTGQSDSREFFPLVRHGIATQAGTLSIGRGFLPAHRAVVGEAEFGPACELKLAPSPQTPVAIQAGFWMAFRTPQGDPIVWIENGADDIALLQPIAAVSLSVMLGGDHPTGGLGYPVAIPSDPDLAGAIVLFQFVAVSPTGSVGVSDVFGTTIWSEAPAAMRSSNGSDAGLRDLRRVAAERSMELSGRLGMTPEKQTEVIRLQRMLRSQLEARRR